MHFLCKSIPSIKHSQRKHIFRQHDYHKSERKIIVFSTVLICGYCKPIYYILYDTYYYFFPFRFSLFGQPETLAISIFCRDTMLYSLLLWGFTVLLKSRERSVFSPGSSRGYSHCPSPSHVLFGGWCIA